MWDWLAPQGFDWSSDFPRVLVAYFALFCLKKVNQFLLDLFVGFNSNVKPLNVEKYEVEINTKLKDD